MKIPTTLICALLLATSNAQSADVNPFTGTEASVADLKRQLEIANLENQIATAKAAKARTDRELKEPKALPPSAPDKFGTLKYPTDKLPIPDLGSFLKPKGKGPIQPDPAATPAAPPPAIVQGPRLMGVISDGEGRVAIVEQGGKLMQAATGESAHGQKVGKIGEGWAELGGKRLVQDKSNLALVTNVDKQPMAPRVGGSPVPTTMPAGQPMSFMPPGFGGQ